MTFSELDTMIRDSYPESPERRRILDGLHGIEEGLNLCTTFFFGVTGHRLEDGKWTKETSTQFQVNPV